MKKILMTIALFFLLVTPAWGQPVPAPARPAAKPAPVMAAPAVRVVVPAPAMAAAPAPAMAVAPAPVAPAAPVAAAAPAPVTAAPAVPAPTQPAMSAAPAAPAAKPSTDEKATKWLEMLTPLLIGIIAFVLAYLNKQNKLEALKSERAKKILGYVKIGVDSFDKYAAGTDRKWDDAVAKMLKDANAALMAVGEAPMSTEEEAQARSQAGALKSLTEDDAAAEKAAEKPADKPEA